MSVHAALNVAYGVVPMSVIWDLFLNAKNRSILVDMASIRPENDPLKMYLTGQTWKNVPQDEKRKIVQAVSLLELE